jgi:hypothetical protein
MSKLIYLSTFNYGYIDFAKNNVLNFVQALSSDNSKLILVCMDDESYDEITDFIKKVPNYKIEVLKDVINLKESADFNTNEFMKITHKKLSIILDFVKKYPLIHFFDSDVFFFKNPESVIFEKAKYNDMIFQQDSPRVHNHSLYSNYVCTGNFTIRRTHRSIKLLETIISLVNPHQNDQELLYNYLNVNCSNIKQYKECVLDVYNPDEFQNGFDTFQGGYASKSEKIAVHANHMVGKDKKIESLKAIGAWII